MLVRHLGSEGSASTAWLGALVLVAACASCGGTSAYWQGNELLSRGDYPAALEALSRAVEEDPENYSAFLDRGQAYESMGLLEEAVADYGYAIDLLPHFSSAYFSRGVVLARQGDDQRAVEDYDMALHHLNTIVTDPRGGVIKTNPADIYYNRGNALYRLDLLEEAVVSFDHTIALAPQFARAHDNRGVVHAKLGNQDAACRDRTRACELGYKPACQWVERNCD